MKFIKGFIEGITFPISLFNGINTEVFGIMIGVAIALSLFFALFCLTLYSCGYK